jgi:hypothetical protein
MQGGEREHRFDIKHKGGKGHGELLQYSLGKRGVEGERNRESVGHVVFALHILVIGLCGRTIRVSNVSSNEKSLTMRPLDDPTLGYFVPCTWCP